MIMGNRKFKFSEMIPNAWFYKLKEMGGRSNNHNRHSHQLSKKKNPSPPPPQPPLETDHLFSIPVKPHQDSVSQLRKSYYFTRELNPKPTLKSPDTTSDFLDPPRKSSKKRRPTTTTSKKTSTSTTTTTTAKCSSSSSSLGDESCIVIDVDTKSLDLKKDDSVSLLQLPPIRTYRKKFNNPVKVISGTHEAIDEPTKLKNISSKSRETGAYESFPVKVPREESMASSVFKEQGIRPVRRFPTGSPRVKIRINSPRLAKRVQINSSRRSMSASSRRSISSDSMAVVKSSDDPQRDFRDSMVEMIVENNIRTSKDLEELLACYLSLNSDEYHGVIIEVFRQIWFDLDNIRVRKVVA